MLDKNNSAWLKFTDYIKPGKVGCVVELNDLQLERISIMDLQCHVRGCSCIRLTRTVFTVFSWVKVTCEVIFFI